MKQDKVFQNLFIITFSFYFDDLYVHLFLKSKLFYLASFALEWSINDITQVGGGGWQFWDIINEALNKTVILVWQKGRRVKKSKFVWYH